MRRILNWLAIRCGWRQVFVVYRLTSMGWMSVAVRKTEKGAYRIFNGDWRSRVTPVLLPPWVKP